MIPWLAGRALTALQWVAERLARHIPEEIRRGEFATDRANADFHVGSQPLWEWDPEQWQDFTEEMREEYLTEWDRLTDTHLIWEGPFRYIGIFGGRRPEFTGKDDVVRIIRKEDG